MVTKWFQWKTFLICYGFYVALLSLKLYLANQQMYNFGGFRYLLDMKVTQMHTFKLGLLCFRWRLRVWMRRLSQTHSTGKEQHFLVENLSLYKELQFRECRCFTNYFCIKEIQLSLGISPLSTSYSVCNFSQTCQLNTNHALHPPWTAGEKCYCILNFLCLLNQTTYFSAEWLRRALQSCAKVCFRFRRIPFMKEYLLHFPFLSAWYESER